MGIPGAQAIIRRDAPRATRPRSRGEYAFALAVLFAALLSGPASGRASGGAGRSAPTSGVPRRCVVIARSLTDEGGAPSGPAIARVLRENGCEAGAVGAGPGTWESPPAGTSASEAAAFVTAGFGGQSGAYAFRFAGPGGALSAAAHVPYRKTWRNSGMVWVVPDRAIAFGLLESFSLREDEDGGRVPLTLRVTPLEARASGGGGGLDLDGMALDDDAGLEAGDADKTLDELSAVDVAKALPAFRAMALWGAWASGYRPSRGPAEANAELAVRTLNRAATLRLRVSGGRPAREVTRERVPEDDYQAVISRMFRQVALGGRLRDFGRASAGKAKVLSVSARRICVLDGPAIRGLDPSTGRRVYPPPDDARPEAAKPWAGSFVRRRSAGGSWAVLRYSKSIARVDPVDGRATVLAPTGVERAWGFDVAEDGRVACATGWDVALFAAGARRWSRRAGAPVTCGPIIVKDLVVFGTEAGGVAALAARDGSARWRARLPGRAYGRPIRSGGDVLVFCNADESLYALRLADGQARWRRPVGDVLVAAPERCGGGLLVASKANRLMLLDPADGRVRRELAWPAWIVDVARAGDGAGEFLVLADATGTVAYVDSRTLEVGQRIDLGRRLVPGIVHSRDAPARWGAAAGAARALGDAPETAPAVVVSDADGFLYLLACPTGGE